MRNGIPGQRKGLQRATGIVALSACLATAASAQIVFDGNIVWNNGNLTAAGQYTGVAAAGAPSCAANPNANAVNLATVKYPNNSFVDPLLGGALDIVNPSWRPSAGSPAFANQPGHGKVVELPNDGFLQPACFTGALGPDGDDWTTGWTYYDSLGTGRDDLHLPGMTDPRPLVVLDSAAVDAAILADPSRELVLTTANNYLIRGMVPIRHGGTLIIKPGVVIFQERATIGAIQIKRGSNIIADGKRDSVIIITTDAPPGQMVTGGTGGLFINGLARGNRVDTCAGDSIISEGGNAGFYGGNDDDDNSGVLRYVRIEYAGAPVSPNNESNSFTFNATGRGTTMEYLQAHRGKDDSFEWFGGWMRAKHLVATDGDDDGLDTQLGTRGSVQFAIVRLLASNAGAERGIESDNNEFNETTTLCSGRSHPIFANVTMVGDRRTGTGLTGVGNGMIFRRGTAEQFLNGIVFNFKTAALNINGDNTWEAHCANEPAAPALYTGCSTVDVAVASGNVFLTRGYPTPFRQSVTIAYTLPAAGDVRVDVYEANGRLVQTLVDGTQEAGPHRIAWNTGGSVPSGLYFYKVRLAGQESVGRVVRVD